MTTYAMTEPTGKNRQGDMKLDLVLSETIELKLLNSSL